MSKEDALQRLRTARGHIEGVIRMLQDSRYCIDVLHQIDAVQRGLDGARRAVLDQHLRSCVRDAYDEGRTEDVVAELLSVLTGSRRASQATIAKSNRTQASTTLH